jgi:choline dehydrogenase-like flavoprotein
MRIGIIGSGISGTTAAYLLTAAGHTVEIFEKGPAYPYPHNPQFQDRHFHLYDNPAYHLAPDLKANTSDGIPFDLEAERYMRAGGSATVWEGICIRMHPSDFRTRTLYGYGDDWPITYDDLEPYYGQAESLLGVSGTDDDNPFAPPRSTPFPLPQFELAHDDQIMAARLAGAGISLHTTPQARTRRAYEDRAGCANFGTCRVCPIGARYSPNYHLQKALATGLCSVLTGTSVRRVVTESNGRPLVVFRSNDDTGADQMRDYDAVMVAAGAVETARLLLLSADERHPDGLGNSGGWVGRGLAFHHVWKGRMRYDAALYPFRFGGWTGQSQQFIDPPTRGQHASLKVEFSSRQAYEASGNWETARNPREAMLPMLQWRQIVLQAEAISDPDNRVILSGETDRFGDPFAHVVHRFSDFDGATYDFARGVFDQFVSATRPVQSEYPPLDWWDSGSHHMGSCRMSETAADGVVDSFGQMHDAPGVFVLGGATYVGTSGAANPTLTMVALAIRSTEYLMEQDSS